MACHNGAQRLRETLTRLSAQEVRPDVNWEVILVDNLSTDNSVDIAREVWSDCVVPLRIVSEEKLGAGFARHKGILEANFAYVAFIDDDNWISPGWINLAVDLLSSYPRAGAIGGYCEAVYEVDPPDWFEPLKQVFALGSQSHGKENAPSGVDYLWGAGCVVRRGAYLAANGNIEALLTGRQGTALGASAEESEICCRLRLSGWQLMYCPQLRLQHCMTKKRLTWEYMRCMYWGFGQSAPVLSAYQTAIARANGNDHALPWEWHEHLSIAIEEYLREAQCASESDRQPGEVATRFDYSAGKLSAVLQLKEQFPKILATIEAVAMLKQQQTPNLDLCLSE